MSMSFFQNSTSFFDTAMCVVSYTGDAQLGNNSYLAFDLYSAKTPFNLVGSQAQAYGSLLDIKQKGQSDWLVHSSSYNTCETYVCTFTCNIYRPMTSNETTDVSVVSGASQTFKAGFKVYQSSTATTFFGGESISPFSFKF